MVGKKTAHPTYFVKELFRIKLVAPFRIDALWGILHIPLKVVYTFEYLLKMKGKV